MLEGFSVIFLSILIEALPFVILGAFVASLIEVFVTPAWLVAHLPRQWWLSYPLAGLMGLIFPVCECAIVPIMRRLVTKGVPVGIATTIMLSVPIVNPVVLLSTYYAFPDSPIPWLRGGLGYLGAVLIGLSLSRLKKSDVLTLKTTVKPGLTLGGVAKPVHLKGPSVLVSTTQALGIKSAEEKGVRLGIKALVLKVLGHTQHELFDVGRFLILGAFVSASLQTFVPRVWLTSAGGNTLVSILLMMTLAFVLSLCSEADAFVASTFRYQFSQSSLLAFLIFGPMIDIKNALMLMGTFKGKFVRRLIATIAIVCFTLALVVSLFG